MLARAAYRRLAVRFDVLAIDPAPDGGPARLTWIRDAFRT
jgi:Holliday junction resolvase-like predicted endonuclease